MNYLMHLISQRAVALGAGGSYLFISRAAQTLGMDVAHLIKNKTTTIKKQLFYTICIMLNHKKYIYRAEIPECHPPCMFPGLAFFIGILF